MIINDQELNKLDGLHPKRKDNKEERQALYSIDRDTLLDLCYLFPKAAKKLQEYSIKQVVHLSETRQKKQHLHHGNFVKLFYRKNELFLDQKAKVESDLAIDI